MQKLLANKYLTSCCLGALAAILALLLVYDGHNFGDDFAQYIAQAKAIAEGKVAWQIANNTFIIESSQTTLGPKIYPWGLPLLLAPLYKIFGFDLIAFKMIGIVSYGLFVGVFYLFCVRFLRTHYALGATLMFALNPMLLHFAANNILSDIPFLLCSFLAIVCLMQLFTPCKHALVFSLIGGGGSTR